MEYKISAGTIARTAVLALALTNQVLSATGHSVLPIESEQLEQIITTGFTVVSSIVAWWNNNSFTNAAIEADKTYEVIKQRYNG
jgi:SPP1 family holin